MEAYINGMRTVNGGRIFDIDGAKFEILGPAHSTHLTNIVVGYYAEGSRKVTIGVSQYGVEIYKYKHKDDLQHYWSTQRSLDDALKMRKYRACVQEVYDAYRVMFEGEHTRFVNGQPM